MWVSLRHAWVPCAHVVLLPSSDFIQMSLLLLLLNYVAINNLEVGLLLWTATGCKTSTTFSLKCCLLSLLIYHPSIKRCILKNRIRTFFCLSELMPEGCFYSNSALYCYEKVTKSKVLTSGLAGWWGQCADSAELRSGYLPSHRNECCL